MISVLWRNIDFESTVYVCIQFDLFALGSRWFQCADNLPLLTYLVLQKVSTPPTKVGSRVLKYSHILAIRDLVSFRNFKNTFRYLKMMSVSTHQ